MSKETRASCISILFEVSHVRKSLNCGGDDLYQRVWGSPLSPKTGEVGQPMGRSLEDPGGQIVPYLWYHQCALASYSNTIITPKLTRHDIKFSDRVQLIGQEVSSSAKVGVLYSAHPFHHPGHVRRALYAPTVAVAMASGEAARNLAIDSLEI